MRKWLPLIILASAQFIMVLDSSVMNVSISQIVADLNTTVTGVQSAITMYTLVMAAFMLVGAKLGDILGRDRAFGLGLAVYGLGSLITSLSPNDAYVEAVLAQANEYRAAFAPGASTGDRLVLAWAVSHVGRFTYNLGPPTDRGGSVQEMQSREPAARHATARCSPAGRSRRPESTSG